jgi:hypothetical protein
LVRKLRIPASGGKESHSAAAKFTPRCRIYVLIKHPSGILVEKPGTKSNLLPSSCFPPSLCFPAEYGVFGHLSLFFPVSPVCLVFFLF